MKDIWTESLKIKKKRNIKKIVLAVIAIILIITMGVLTYLYFTKEDFRNFFDIYILRKELDEDKTSIIEFNSDENAEICAYDKYIGILSKNKFDIYNTSGQQEAELDIPINNVIFDSSNRFIGIAEKDGNSIYMVSGKNIVWEDEVEGNITKIKVNRNGYVAVVISDTSYKTIVSLYGPDGNELFKMFLSTSRISDVSISNDNKYLALAEVDTSSSVIKSSVKIVSIENAQTDADNSIIFIHNADTGKLLTNIKYQEKNRLICMYNNSVDMIYENKNVQLLEVKEKELAFISVELNNSIVNVREKSTGLFTADSDVVLTNTSNQKENTYTINEVAKELLGCGNVIALNVGSELHFINTNGWLIKKYVAKQEISKIVLSENIAGVIYRDKIEIISL